LRLGIDLKQLVPQREQLSAIGQIRFGDYQVFGHACLPQRFLMLFQLCGALYRIDGRDDLAQSEVLPERAVSQQRMQNRQGIGQSGGFYHDAAQWRAIHPRGDIFYFQQRLTQRVGNGAAQASGIEQIDVFRDLLV
jgi:hypothetical protein